MFLPLVSFRKLLVYSCLVGICSILAPTLRAQEGEGSSPLELGRRIVPDVIGIVAGPGFYAQDGSFATGCPCTFTGGVGAGIVAGLMYEKNLLAPNANWRLGSINIGARLLYEDRRVNAAFREYETVPVQSLAQPLQRFPVQVLFRHLAEASFSTLSLTPYIVWNPLTIGIFQPFVQVGLQGGFIMNSRLKHTKFVLDHTVRLPNGEEAEVSFAETNSDRIVIQDSAFLPLNTFQLAASLAVGADMPLGTRFRLSPMLQYLLPLTTINPPPGNLTITAWQILLALKMNLER